MDAVEAQWVLADGPVDAGITAAPRVLDAEAAVTHPLQELDAEALELRWGQGQRPLEQSGGSPVAYRADCHSTPESVVPSGPASMTPTARLSTYGTWSARPWPVAMMTS